MDVIEVIRLADWFSQNTTEVDPLYLVLVSVLQNNAQQPSQLPVAEPLNGLSEALAEMPTQELSAIQMRLLNDLEVADLIGRRGKRWLNLKVRATTYDPATTFLTIQRASQLIADAKRRLNEFKVSAGTIGITSESSLLTTSLPSAYVINIIFQGDVSITNVRDWKKTAADWDLIISGVAGVAGEKPEEVKVIGTSNGSIILSLSATGLVTKILATISKHIAHISNDYLDFQLKREDLERSRMMSQAIRNDLSRQESERRLAGQREVIDAVKKIVPNAKPDSLASLEKAVEKHIAFSERGGDVDFVTPPVYDEDTDGFDQALAVDVAEIRELIEAYRSEKRQTKLLMFTDEISGDED